MQVGRTVALVVRTFSIALIALALTCALLLVCQGVFNPFHVVASNSMAPQIETGDAVMIRDMKPEDVKVGEVIIFVDPQQKDQFVIHRVTAIEDTGYARLFTTKGDNNKVTDPVRVPTGNVVGGMAVRLPHFGIFLNFLRSTAGYLSCIAVPGFMSLLVVFGLAIYDRETPPVVRVRSSRSVFAPHPTASIE